jgi:hypothetical protein
VRLKNLRANVIRFATEAKLTDADQRQARDFTYCAQFEQAGSRVRSNELQVTREQRSPNSSLSRKNAAAAPGRVANAYSLRSSNGREQRFRAQQRLLCGASGLSAGI